MTIIIFGGGKIELSTTKYERRESVPLSIQLLFENTKLDLTKTIILLYAFKLNNKRKKVRNVPEILFYYSLINFGLLELFTLKKPREASLVNRFFRYDVSLNLILLELSQLGFVEIIGHPTGSRDDMGIKITLTGIAFVDELNSDFFKKLVKRYLDCMDEIEFSVKNMNYIKEV